MVDVVTTAVQSVFPIIGVGAAAGGLEAFTQLLRLLPRATGCSFVLIQHSNRGQLDGLREVLAGATDMLVCQAEQGMRVEPDHVYFVPPDVDLAVQAGQLALLERSSQGIAPFLPVDFFLRSLAAERGSQAVGIILSGAAADGTEGLRAIRARAGTTYAQTPRTAKFPAMPQRAVDAGVVDHCLDVPELAAQLSRYADALQSTSSERDAERASLHDVLLAKHLDRLLIDRYCPPCVLIAENMKVLHSRGRTGACLHVMPGQLQTNLLGMVRGGVLAALQATVARAKLERVPVRSRDVAVEWDGSSHRCDLLVIPVGGLPEHLDPLFVVLFEEPEPAQSATELELPPDDLPAGTSPVQRHIARLEHELSITQEYMRALMEEHALASVELERSTHAGAELLRVREELALAKQELRSADAARTSLQDELRTRSRELSRGSLDLENFSRTVDIALLTLDLERRVRRFTLKAQSVLNVQPADTGRLIEELSLHVPLPELNQQIAEVVATGAILESEVQDQHGRWYRLQIRPYFAAERVEGVLLSLVDIDVLKQLVQQAEVARQEAERANRAKDEFLGLLSHELRTPLSSMLLYAQRLSGGDLTAPAELRRAGAALERTTSLQAKLIDELLDVSRIAAHKLLLDCRPVDLGESVRATLEELNPQIEAKALALTLSLAPGTRRIWADRVRVQQIISNLVGNAIKFTPRAGRLTISVEASERFARLSVADSGIGIEPAFLPHVFERFSQSDSSITRRYGGLGLGLALVQELTELHGGTVRAESEGPGAGAVFSVSFPLARTSDTAEPGVGMREQRSHALDRAGKMNSYDALSGLRVLFVDDDLRTREVVLEVLQYTGARVELAASVSDGMRAVAAFKPQVILCDIAMPGEDGFSFMRQLQAWQVSQGVAPIPTLAFSAQSSEQDRNRAFAAGFQLHLAKPVDIDRLRDAVLELSKTQTRVATELPS